MDTGSGAQEKRATETEIIVPAILLKMCNREIIQMTRQIYSYFWLLNGRTIFEPT